MDTVATPSSIGQNPSSDEGVDIRELIRSLLRYRWVIISSAILATLGAVLWTLAQDKVYEAICSIEYDVSGSSVLGNDIDDVAKPAFSFWLSREFYGTQNYILESRSLARRVVKSLELHKNPRFMGVPAEERAKWKGATIDQAAARLQGRVHIEPVEDTRIVRLRAQDSDAKRAALIANAYAEAFIEKSVDDRLATTTKALTWLRERSDSLQQKLRSSELALLEFKRKKSALSVALEDRQNTLAQEIERYSHDLTSARINRIRLESKLRELERVDPDSIDAVDSAVVNRFQHLQELREEYQQALRERGKLKVNYGDAHPSVQAINATVAALQVQIQKGIANITESARSELREARAVESQLAAKLREVQGAGLELNEHQIEYERLRRDRDNYADLYETILERTTETNLSSLLRVSTIRIIDRALPSFVPVAPRPVVNVLAGIAVGSLLGFLIALLLSALNKTLRFSEQIEAIGLATLSSIPNATRRGRPRLTSPLGRRADRTAPGLGLVVQREPRSSTAEAFRSLRTNLAFAGKMAEAHSYLLTSTSPNDGKSSVTANLATSFAQSGRRTLVIDADMRRSTMHSFFAATTNEGNSIGDVLSGRCDIADAIQSTKIDRLDIMPCMVSPPNPSELLHSEAFRQLLKYASQHYDRVLFDSPPLELVADASIVAPQVDAVVLVARAGVTSQRQLLNASKHLSSLQSVIAGVVLNAVDPTVAGYRQLQRGYISGYYHSSSDADGSGVKPLRKAG